MTINPRNLTIPRCNLRYDGVVKGCDSRAAAIVDTTGYDVLTVQVYAIEGTWTNTIIRVRWSAAYHGPFLDYSTIIQLDTNKRGITVSAVQARFMAVEVTTGEGANLFVDVNVHMRASAIGTAVGV